jgi:hypothetical protein
MNAAKNATATFDALPPFDFGSPPAPKTISAGQSAQFMLQVDGQASFTGNVSLSCTSGVPPEGGCSFNPAWVTPAGGSATTTLTVTTTARTTAALVRPSARMFAYLLMPLVLVLGSGARRSRQWVRLACLGILLAVTGTIVACGGGSGGGPPPLPGTPAATYTITVTAASGGNPTKTQAVTLVVN